MNKAKKNFLKTLEKEKISKKVIDVFTEVEKENFIDPIFHKRLYTDEPVPIGSGQFSDDPLTLARMIHALSLKKRWRVLEIGTGSGYSTALIASLVREVITIEYHEDLARAAKKHLFTNGYSNMRLFAGDATEFYKPIGEFNAVIVFAACAHSPYSLINLLMDGGKAVFPMGPAAQQQIALYTNSSEKDPSVDSFKFFNYCTFDSIRGRYGHVDRPVSYIVEEPDLTPTLSGEDE